MNLGLDGCVAIVGGSSSGMGRAIAKTLAQEGCDVVLFARREALLAQVAEEIEQVSGRRALPVAGDAGDPAALERAVATASRELGRIDIVVNNTGGPPAGEFDDFDDAAWKQSFELTALSALRLTRLALPELRSSGRGRVVNITSSTVREVADRLLLSNALRPAVVGWAKSLSRTEGPHGITVNSIAPGYIDTERLAYLYSTGEDPEGDRERAAQSIPLRRFGSPEEIAAAVAFLCSTAASYISGVTLLVDGGLARGLLS